MSENYFIGIDVGTGSARAGIFDEYGNMLAQASHSIKMWKPEADYVQQSSEDIWKACCNSVREAISKSGIKPVDVKGVGFDATCSLVVLGEGDQPLTVSPDKDPGQNIIVWMDHRAKGEASEINESGHEVLKYVGGVISPEMQTPKLLWLKRNMPDTWNMASGFFDLPDYLVYKATGYAIRSACTTTCKWTYLSHEDTESKDSIGQWDHSYFKLIGLEDLTRDSFQKIGKIIRPAGEAVGNGLSEKAAKELGLNPGTAVGVSMIDAHAGGLGLLGMNLNGSHSFDDRIALIGGTSSCHMAVSEQPRFISGVWGPYFSAMIPDFWLNEGGQSATGALVDHIIFSSVHSTALKEKAERIRCTIYDLLNNRLKEMALGQGLKNTCYLTNNLHVLPYFHGNRSPRANPLLTGTITGLKLSSTIDDLALLYLATIQSIAYGTRHIIETLNLNGYNISMIMATGGGTKNELFLQEHADISGCKIILPKESEAVLLGSAILGSVASGRYPTIFDAMKKMNQSGNIVYPTDEVASYHEAKYNIFLKMYEDGQSYSKIMEERFQSVTAN
ncbi:MAG: ribulokinase [Balneolaceae bacterium]|nr:MAG: ribulokinase [Balneolaceae bacterium]